MNHKELENKLVPLTEKELAYKKSNKLSSSYQEFKMDIVDGQEVYVFADKMEPNENITILKHTRYATVPMHIHTFIELNYVYSGQCTQIINGKEVKITEGQICIVDTRVPHSILSTTKEDIIINILIRKEYFTASFLSRLSNKGIISDFIINAISDTQNHNRYIIFHSEKNENIPILIKQLLCEYYDNSLCSEEMIDCYMVLIFSELIQVFQYDTNKLNHHSTNKANLIDILNYIEKNYTSCSLNSTAKKFNYNPNYLSTLIKSGTGKSFKEIIQFQKLNHASFLLANSNIPIYQIALETGHSNLSYFYKKFKDFYDKTPQQFRDTQKQL